jgi:hypothetical protein
MASFKGERPKQKLFCEMEELRTLFSAMSQACRRLRAQNSALLSAWFKSKRMKLSEDGSIILSGIFSTSQKSLREN